jgi:hypothetical protein
MRHGMRNMQYCLGIADSHLMLPLLPVPFPLPQELERQPADRAIAPKLGRHEQLGYPVSMFSPYPCLTDSWYDMLDEGVPLTLVDVYI